MKRSILLFGCLLLFGVPGLVKAVPVTITLDMPNQVVTAPTSGLTTLIFSGSVTLESPWLPDSSSVNSPFNSSQTNALAANVDPAFLQFLTTGTYTGNLFDVIVPAGTAPDLYAFAFMSTNPSVFSVGAFQPFIFAASTGSAPFSVQVNGPATGVPDQGATLLLMGASLAVLGLGRWLIGGVV